MSAEPLRSPLDHFAKAAGLLVFLVVAAITAGAIIMYGWNVFVVRLGVPRLGLVQAIGLDILLTFIVTLRQRKSDDGDLWKAIKHVALVDALAFSLLWLTAQFL